MIAAVMLYGTGVSALLALAAWAAERLLRPDRAARRWPWLLAILAGWLAMAAVLTPGSTASARSATLIEQVGRVSMGGSSAVNGEHAKPAASALPLQNNAMNTALGATWLLASTGLLATFTVAGFLLHRRARRWPLQTVLGTTVRISDDLGPAVLGFWRGAIILPRSTLALPAPQLALILDHERAHITARDSWMLLAALLTLVATPWNLPLWWLLRRLRSAMEFDCDARVLRGGASPELYAETLLGIQLSARSSSLLLLPTMTEPRSQLERRIAAMLTHPRRRHPVVVAALWALTASLTVTAAGLEAPKLSANASFSKPQALDFASGKLPWYIAPIEALLKDKYPTLKTTRANGTPILTILFRADRSVEASNVELYTGDADAFQAQESRFAPLGAKLTEFDFITVRGMSTKANEMIVVLGERRDPKHPHASILLPDTESVDRSIVARHFPDALAGGASPDESLWALFDHGGTLLVSGRDTVPTEKLQSLLESRYGGVKVTALLTTPVFDAKGAAVRTKDGGSLKLHSLWLAEGAVMPGDASPTTSAASPAARP